MLRGTQNLVGEGVSFLSETAQNMLVCLKGTVGYQDTSNLVKPIPEKKKRFGLRPFKIELPERRPGTFRHKNSLVYYLEGLNELSRLIMSIYLI